MRDPNMKKVRSRARRIAMDRARFVSRPCVRCRSGIRGEGVVALAPGYGAGWIEFDPDASDPAANISLRPEQVIHGRFFDLQGRPARDVKLSVSAIRRVIKRNPDRRRDQTEGPPFWRRRAKEIPTWPTVVTTDSTEIPAWPSPVTTDSAGRFSLRGVGRDLRVFLTVNDPRFAQQEIEIETDGNAGSKEVTLALQQPRSSSGG